jgi:flavin reductase (DIM6/NTAB) family NADH-FMN oxidoreductase RutF
MRIDPATLSPGRRYYLLISCIVPRPIAWVGTQNEDGSPNLAPFSFFNGLSGTPPIVGIGISADEDKGSKDTLRNIRRTRELAISIPHAGQAVQVDASGDSLPYGASEFPHAGATPAPGELIAAPRVAEAQVALECQLHDIIALGDAGSHLVLAEIVLFHIEETLLDFHGCVDPLKFKPLARMAGGRYAATGAVFKVERG